MSDLETIRPGRIVFLAAVLVASLAAVACGGSEPAAAPTPAFEQAPAPAPSEAARESDSGPGKIAFVSQRDGNPEIYVMNADGASQTRLTTAPGQDSWPAWSPDGSRIAFSSERDGNPEIYVMDADGANQTRVTNNTDPDVEPAWSPDGARIAYVSTVGEGNTEIYVMDSDGSNQIRLTFNLVREESPAWSPDGAKIVFLSTRQGHQEMFLMNADGSNQVPLMDLEPTGIFRRHLAPAWSPDGARIAYNYRIGESHEIYAVSPDGTGEVPLTTDGGGWPAWSPSGAKIAFMSPSDRNLDIYIMDADGTDRTRLTDDPARDGMPDWAPGSVAEAPVAVQVQQPRAAATQPRAPASGASQAVATLELVATALTEPAESPLAGVHVHGNYAFVGSQSIAYPPFESAKTGIRIVDISDPANPTVVGRIPLRSLEQFSSASGDSAPH